MILSTAILSTLLLTGSPDSGCLASKTAAATNGQDIVATAMASESFTTLTAALKAGDLVSALQGEGPFTVFAPTNEAFAKLPKAQLASLLEPANKSLLQAILTYHVVPGKLMAKDVVEANGAATLNGQRIEFKATDGGVTVDGANVVQADIACTNGVIHVIDSVILPSTVDLVQTALEAGSFKTLAAALDAAQLVEALQGKGPFTVFAPTDAAFAALPEGTVENLLKKENRDQLASILKFHVVSGRVYAADVLAGKELKTLQGQILEASAKPDRVAINGAKLLEADIEASNGVIHVIDAVLLPQ